MTGTVVVVAKAPIPGRVKTRLSPPCNPTEAAAIAEAALVQTLEEVATANAGRRVLALEGAPGSWVPPGFEVVPQRGTGLGERLANILSEVGGPALVVGMDTPQLTVALIEEALRALQTSEAAIGPTHDGGYWGIALRTPDPRVFTGVPMSQPSTFQRQLGRLRALGLSWTVLPVLRDVDFFSDAVAVAAEVQGSRFSRTVWAVKNSRGKGRNDGRIAVQ